MREDKQQAKPWLPDTKVRCPVSPAAQEWIESSLCWCAGEFGRETLVRDVVLPAAGFLPAAYTATTQQIEAIVTRSCTLLSVDPEALRVDLFDGSAEKRAARARGPGKARTVGHFHMEDGVAVIALDRSESADPRYLTAIIAHELGHVRLLGERRISAGRRDHERLTDLLTVYFGFGIFSANAALDYAKAARSWSVHPLGELDERTLNAARNDGYRRLGYLSEHEFGYALACYCWLREEQEEPHWARYLDVGVRRHVKQGLAYLAQDGRGAGLPTQRIVGRTLKYGSTTIRVVSTPTPRSWPPAR
jgi:hypothetical protein